MNTNIMKKYFDNAIILILIVVGLFYHYLVKPLLPAKPACQCENCLTVWMERSRTPGFDWSVCPPNISRTIRDLNAGRPVVL
jgi:hypothetical protein